MATHVRILTLFQALHADLIPNIVFLAGTDLVLVFILTTSASSLKTLTEAVTTLQTSPASTQETPSAVATSLRLAVYSTLITVIASQLRLLEFTFLDRITMCLQPLASKVNAILMSTLEATISDGKKATSGLGRSRVMLAGTLLADLETSMKSCRHTHIINCVHKFYFPHSLPYFSH